MLSGAESAVFYHCSYSLDIILVEAFLDFLEPSQGS